MAAVTTATKIARGEKEWHLKQNDEVQEIVDAKAAYATLKARIDALTAAPSSEWVAPGQTPTFVSTTQFTIPTDLTAQFEVNRRVQAENLPGSLVYSRVTAVAFATVTTVTVADAVLTADLSAVWYSFWNVGSNRAYPDVVGPDFPASQAQGDVYFRGSAGIQRLAAGTSGQFLKTQGAAANPIWADGTPSGVIWLYGGSTAPSGFLLCDGASFALNTYPSLFDAIINNFGNGTATAATADSTTDKITATAHGLVNTDQIYFTATTMPGGLTAATKYFVVSATANDFQVSATSGGATINITSNGSGLNFYKQALLPDLRQRFPLGKAAAGTGSTLGGTGGAIDHTHTYTDVPNHVHSVDPPSTSAVVTDPGHNHGGATEAGGSRSGAGGSPSLSANTGATGHTHGIPSGTTGITASVDIAAFNSANPTGGVATGTTATQNPPFLAVNYIIKQ